MLTRLKVSGFKNLVDVDVRFGPFTCIAGGNGVGKSNLFDAIHFLKLLASLELVEAARSIRDEKGKTGDVRGLFTKQGSGYVDEMSFEVEMITAREGSDRLRQQAKATSTLLKYRLTLRYRGEEAEFGPLAIVDENLHYITKGKASEAILFPHDVGRWRQPILVAERRTGEPYIQTKQDGSNPLIVTIQQEGRQGRPQSRLADPLPRTVLSSLNASEAPTAVVARNEIENWRLLQFEPSALRRPDDFRDAADLSPDGAHMPATLYRLLGNGRPKREGDAIRARITNRLAELVNDVREVRVDRDEKRELLTLIARLRDGTEHPARALSDGTLRFLALSIIEQKPDAGGVFCLEEPENGIHPERIPAMLKLLQAIAVDPEEPAGEDNPLRQVIINTHSPIVVAEVPDDSLVLARTVSLRPAGDADGAPTLCTTFEALSDTWRTRHAGVPACSRGDLLAYLNPVPSHPRRHANGPSGAARRVADRPDLQMLMPFAEVGPDGGLATRWSPREPRTAR